MVVVAVVAMFVRIIIGESGSGDERGVYRAWY